MTREQDTNRVQHSRNVAANPHNPRDVENNRLNYYFPRQGVVVRLDCRLTRRMFGVGLRLGIVASCAHGTSSTYVFSLGNHYIRSLKVFCITTRNCARRFGGDSARLVCGTHPLFLGLCVQIVPTDLTAGIAVHRLRLSPRCEGNQP